MMLVSTGHGSPFGLLLCSILPLLTASLTIDLAAHISRVEVIPTVDLVMGANADNCGHPRISPKTDAPENWLDPKMYPKSLQSVLVHALDRHEDPNSFKMCVLMADNRFSLWDRSSNRAATFESAESRRAAKWMLPAMVNFVHAVRQGYDFVHVHLPYQRLARHPAWWKLAAIRIILPLYNFVLFMDTDAFFRQPGRPKVIEAMIAEAQLGRGKVMAVPRDLNSPDVANTGILLFEQGEQACNILQEWWYSVVLHPEYIKYKMEWSYEQAIFSQLLLPRYNHSITLLDGKDWNSPEGTQLRHVWGAVSDNDRECLFMKAAVDTMGQLEGIDAVQGFPPAEISAQLATLINHMIAHKLAEKV